MTKSQITTFVRDSSVERIREVLNHLQALKTHQPLHHLPEQEQRFILDLRDHEEHFRGLADQKLHQAG
jgi:Mg/Co/Ni transporter MgtE